MKKKEKIEIHFCEKEETDFDFGFISRSLADGVLMLDKDLWARYVDARFAYEMFHKDLVIRVHTVMAGKMGKRRRQFSSGLK